MKGQMSQPKQIIQAYRIITSDLHLKNLDGTNPAPNLAIFTDGAGGTYKSNLGGAISRPGFNEISITNSRSTIVADLSRNILSFTAGPGISIIKDNVNQNNLIFESGVTSTLTGVLTPSGEIYADSPSANLHILPDYGIKLRVSTNSLYIGSAPSFNSLKIPSATINATENVSTINIQNGPGIVLSSINSNTLLIDTNPPQTLNQISLSNSSTIRFTEPYNNLNIATTGSLTVSQTDTSTLTFSSNAFNRISTNTGVISNISTLTILPSTGITTSIVNNSLIIGTNLPQSITSISTSSGLISNYSTINIINGQGIICSSNENSLLIKTDKPYFSQITAANTSTINASSTNNLNLLAGPSIVYSTIGSSLQIDTVDFNRVNVNNQQSLYSSQGNKSLNLSTSGDIKINADISSNTLTFSVTPNNSYFYTNINISDSSDPNKSGTISANSQNNTINLVSKAPLTLSTSLNSVYLGIDSVSLLSSTSNNISSLQGAISSLTNNGNLQSLSINGTPVITNNRILNGPNKIDISANYIEANLLNISSIGIRSKPPLVSFDFNKGFMYTKGTIVAENFATFSDSSLKKFTSPFKVSNEDLISLQPWNFDWLADGKHDIGFAAEDVEKIAPELVRINNNGLRMVDYGRLSVVAISGLRTMNEKILKLESDIEKLYGILAQE